MLTHTIPSIIASALVHTRHVIHISPLAQGFKIKPFFFVSFNILINQSKALGHIYLITLPGNHIRIFRARFTNQFLTLQTWCPDK